MARYEQFPYHGAIRIFEIKAVTLCRCKYTMMKTELVIFDLDGTLLDTIGDLAAACNHTLAVCGHPQHPLESYRTFVGNGITKLVERYQSHIADLTRPYGGVVELLDALRGRGIAVAVASNKYQAGTEILVRRFLGDCFAVVFGQRDGVPVKPDPRIVRDILAATGVGAGSALYVGDSDVDMATAANASLESVGVAWGFRPKAELVAAGANHLIDRPEQLLEIVRL